MDAILKALLPAAAAALLLTFAFPPLGFWPLAWVALAPLYAGLTLPGRRRSPAVGFVFGFVLFLVGMQWMTKLAPPLWIGLALIQATFFAAFAWLTTRVARPAPPASRPLLFAAAWVLFEWIRSLGLYAFPWFLLASAHARPSALPWLQVVALTGQWGLSFTVAAVNGYLAEAVRQRQPRLLAPAIALFLGLGAGGRLLASRPTAPALPIAIVQGSEDRSFRGDIFALYETLSQQALPHRPALILWPEGTVPGDSFGQTRLSALARSLKTTLLAGTYDRDEARRPRNWAMLFDRDGALRGRYLKQRLAPFGEVYPFRQALPSVYASFGVLHDSYVAGDRPGAIAAPGLNTVGVAICYESAFPWVTRGSVRAGAELLSFLTSDQTFDGTVELRQHLDLAVVRAVEVRRPILRAASTGISAVIQSNGQVTAMLPNRHRGALVATCYPEKGQTLFVQLGDWFLSICFAIILVGIVSTARSAPGSKTKQPSPEPAP